VVYQEIHQGIQEISQIGSVVFCQILRTMLDPGITARTVVVGTILDFLNLVILLEYYLTRKPIAYSSFPFFTFIRYLLSCLTSSGIVYE
jgi:hypothetical protein